MKNKIFIALTCLTTVILGQGNSPFSQFGPGSTFGSHFNSNFSLAGIGASTASANQINGLNPASYSKIKFTTGEVGLFSSNNWYTLNGITDSKNHTSLSKFGMAFPLMKDWGFGFGLQPYSKLNYSFSVNDVLQDLSTVDYIYEGSGGLNTAFLGTGYSYKGFSLGVNGEFVFGRLNNITKVKYANSEFNSVRFQNFNNVAAFNWNTGVQYDFEVNEDVFGKFGATYQIESAMNTSAYTKANYFVVDQTTNTNNEEVEGEFHNSELIIDTENAPSEGTLVLPQRIQAGITIGKADAWTLSAEYSLQEWSKFSLNGQENTLVNEHFFMLGGSIIPNSQALGKENYWKSIEYNFGLKYGMSKIIYNDNQLPEYGINLGCRLPLKKFKYETEKFGSYINFSIGYLHRGNGSSSSINEDYLNLNIGVTLNDKWFIKRKFN